MKQPANPRDFSGYRWQYPSMRWPSGAGLALSFVLNVEEGAELSLSAGDGDSSVPRSPEASFGRLLAGHDRAGHARVRRRIRCHPSHFPRP